jgi:hypothetical protein
MRFLPSSTLISKSVLKTASILLFATLLTVSGFPVVASARAQQPPEPGTLPETETPPPPAVFENRIPSDQLAFLKEYEGKPAKELRKDKRFKALMKQITPRTEYHYGRDMPLSDAIDTVFDGNSLPVDIRDGRYATVASSGGEYLSGRGFVWFDLQEGIVLGGVFFRPVNGEPTPTLAVFSRQLKETVLGMSQLPAEFARDVAQWSLIAHVPPVTVRYFIPDNGKKYVLLHDEDYCEHPETVPVQNAGACEQLNADAADADLNGADFMEQTHNQANATAWMLSPAQVSWIGVRNSTCGPLLGCRIQMTRARTRTVIGGGGGGRGTRR